MSVLYETRDNIAFITLNRPESMNALDPESFEELGRIWEDFRDDPDLRVAIVTGTGDRAFSAGNDLKRMAQRAHPVLEYFFPTERRRLEHGGIELWKPIIAAVNGYCLAAGLELALACDLRIASENASFGALEVKRGLLHGAGALRLTRAIPMAVAMEMLLTGERISAQEAYRVGLVSRLVSRAELLPTAERLARIIADNAPLAVRATKEIAVRGLSMNLADGLRLRDSMSRLLFQTEDSREGPRAFAEKRPARYQGR
ncbi:MAG: enoyl-CoA hydratase/isomerase family protein [Chloroflexi bacterium]|nr:enoyl-CoA hydratase/isomerase family protein [Chloroflexota bacterium]